MRNRSARVLGGASIVGGTTSVLVNIPSGWYGLTPPDSYVFDPVVLSPLWYSRTVVPVLAVVAAVGLLLGVAGLVRRDWAVAGRARRWGGLGAVGATAGFVVASVLWPRVGGGGAGDALVGLVALAVGAVSVLVLVPSAAFLAYGYGQTARPAVGYAFGGLLVGVPVLALLVPDLAQTFGAALPVGALWWVIGMDLLRHPEPLS